MEIIEGREGIWVLLPFGKIIVPKGIWFTILPIVAVSEITISLKDTESNVTLYSSTLASILSSESKFKFSRS